MAFRQKIFSYIGSITNNLVGIAARLESLAVTKPSIGLDRRPRGNILLNFGNKALRKGIGDHTKTNFTDSVFSLDKNKNQDRPFCTAAPFPLLGSADKRFIKKGFLVSWKSVPAVTEV